MVIRGGLGTADFIHLSILPIETFYFGSLSTIPLSLSLSLFLNLLSYLDSHFERKDNRVDRAMSTSLEIFFSIDPPSILENNMFFAMTILNLFNSNIRRNFYIDRTNGRMVK